MNKKGWVMVHVLITTILVVVIATGLAQMVMLRFTAAHRATDGLQKKRQTEGTLARVMDYWNVNGFCASPGSGITCSGVTSTCSSCSCSITAVAPHTVAGAITASGTYPNCQLNIRSTVLNTLDQ